LNLTLQDYSFIAWSVVTYVIARFPPTILS